MFGTVIKNTLLFLLIIFILHFMINNLLIDMDLNGFSVNGSIPKNINTNEVKVLEEEVLDNTAMIEVDLPRPERDEKQDKDAIKMKELYDYVYDKDATNKLDNFYKMSNDIDVSNSKDVQIKCADSLCNNVNNYCNTSLPVKQELEGHYSNFNKVQCESDIKDSSKHPYIVKKYDNESPMNGGALDETNIEAFDTLDGGYELL
jgi:hypothetical protein